MPKPDRFVEFCMERCALLGSIESRYMFGCWCLYCDGFVFALVAHGLLYLKGDDQNIPEFNARNMQAFRPFPDKPDIMKYFQAPTEIFEDDDLLRQLVGSAVKAGKRAKSKKKSPAKAVKRVASPKKDAPLR